MKNEPVPYDKIARYTLHQCSAEEQHEVEHWINASKEHQTLYETLQKEWRHLHDQPEQFVSVDKQKVLGTILNRIADTKKPSSRKYLMLRVASAAAMIALLLGMGITFLYQSVAHRRALAQQVTTIETAAGEKMRMTLPDGTKVHLNGNSKLSYTADFHLTNRKIKLEGEAFFEVVKKSQQQFTVATSHLDVIVRGTSFDVSAYEADQKIIVSLLSGAVTLKDKEGKQISDLSPNELAILSTNTMTYRIFSSDATIHQAWIHDELIFHNDPLEMILKKLERWYGIDITWKACHTDVRYTFTVKTESLRELLELFNKITPIAYEINGREVVVAYR